MNGSNAGKVASSTSKLMAHWRAKYSLGRKGMWGQNPPKVSACSSRRSSQKGTHPPPDSRNTMLRLGWRSRVPRAINCAQASISSNEWETAWRIRGLKGRSEPRVGTITELPSWMPTGTPSSSATRHTGW